MEKEAIDGQTQKAILEDLTIHFLTIKQIANRRQTTVQAVYKIVEKLKKKGLIAGNCRGGFKIIPLSGGVGFKTSKKWRLHGQQFHINLIQDSGYQNRTIQYKGATIQLYRRSIEVYAGSNEFIADSPKEAYDASLKYWLIFFYRLEHKFKLMFVKDGWGFEQVAAHYEERQNELTRNYRENNRQRLKVRATRDGKVWLEMDASLNTDNLEEKHPVTALEDATKVSRYFNEIRDKDIFFPEETTAIIKGIVQINKEYAENIKSHIKAIQDLNRGVNEFRQEVSRFRHYREDKQETIKKWF